MNDDHSSNEFCCSSPVHEPKALLQPAFFEDVMQNQMEIDKNNKEKDIESLVPGSIHISSPAPVPSLLLEGTPNEMDEKMGLCEESRVKNKCDSKSSCNTSSAIAREGYVDEHLSMNQLNGHITQKKHDFFGTVGLGHEVDHVPLNKNDPSKSQKGVEYEKSCNYSQSHESIDDICLFQEAYIKRRENSLQRTKTVNYTQVMQRPPKVKRSNSCYESSSFSLREGSLSLDYGHCTGKNVHMQQIILLDPPKSNSTKSPGNEKNPYNERSCEISEERSYSQLKASIKRRSSVAVLSRSYYDEFNSNNDSAKMSIAKNTHSGSSIVENESLKYKDIKSEITFDDAQDIGEKGRCGSNSFHDLANLTRSTMNAKISSPGSMENRDAIIRHASSEDLHNEGYFDGYSINNHGDNLHREANIDFSEKIKSCSKFTLPAVESVSSTYNCGSMNKEPVRSRFSKEKRCWSFCEKSTSGNILATTRTATEASHYTYLDGASNESPRSSKRHCTNENSVSQTKKLLPGTEDLFSTSLSTKCSDRPSKFQRSVTLPYLYRSPCNTENQHLAQGSNPLPELHLDSQASSLTNTNESNSNRAFKTPTCESKQSMISEAEASLHADALKKKGIKMFIIDFDKTLIKIHTHGDWRKPIKYLRDFVRPIFINYISAMLSNQIGVGIATFSPQEELIENLMTILFPSSAIIGKNVFIKGSPYDENLKSYHHVDCTSQLSDDCSLATSHFTGNDVTFENQQCSSPNDKNSSAMKEKDCIPNLLTTGDSSCSSWDDDEERKNKHIDYLRRVYGAKIGKELKNSEILFIDDDADNIFASVKEGVHGLMFECDKLGEIGAELSLIQKIEKFCV